MSCLPSIHLDFHVHKSLSHTHSRPRYSCVQVTPAGGILQIKLCKYLRNTSKPSLTATKTAAAAAAAARLKLQGWDVRARDGIKGSKPRPLSCFILLFLLFLSVAHSELNDKSFSICQFRDDPQPLGNRIRSRSARNLLRKSKSNLSSRMLTTLNRLRTRYFLLQQTLPLQTSLGTLPRKWS